MGREETRDVLEDPPRRAGGPGDSDDLVEEAGSLPGEPGSLAGDAEILAGETAADEINVVGAVPSRGDSVSVLSAGIQVSGSSELCALRDFTNVPSSFDSRPSVREDSLAEGVDLDLPGALVSCSFESKVESSDA